MSLSNTCEACWECVLGLDEGVCVRHVQSWREPNEEVSGSGDSALFEASVAGEQLWARGQLCIKCCRCSSSLPLILPLQALGAFPWGSATGMAGAVGDWGWQRRLRWRLWAWPIPS